MAATKASNNNSNKDDYTKNISINNTEEIGSFRTYQLTNLIINNNKDYRFKRDRKRGLS